MDISLTEKETEYDTKLGVGGTKKHLPNAAEKILSGNPEKLKFTWKDLDIECPVKKEAEGKEGPEEKPDKKNDRDADDASPPR